MFMYKIKVVDLNNEGLFDAVLRELPDLCSDFHCYPQKGLFIVNSSEPYPKDALQARRINTEHILVTML